MGRYYQEQCEEEKARDREAECRNDPDAVVPRRVLSHGCDYTARHPKDARKGEAKDDYLKGHWKAPEELLLDGQIRFVGVPEFTSYHASCPVQVLLQRRFVQTTLVAPCLSLRFGGHLSENVCSRIAGQ